VTNKSKVIKHLKEYVGNNISFNLNDKILKHLSFCVTANAEGVAVSMGTWRTIATFLSVAD
jgi:uncharacterized Fe-S cluster protein YjdI